MNLFKVREIAKAWAAKFGGTDGCEERAFLAGARAALEYAGGRCLSGSTPSMIRLDIYNKIVEIDGKGERA